MIFIKILKNKIQIRNHNPKTNAKKTQNLSGSTLQIDLHQQWKYIQSSKSCSNIPRRTPSYSTPLPPLQSTVSSEVPPTSVSHTLFSLNSFYLPSFPQFGCFALTGVLSVHRLLTVCTQVHISPIVPRLASPEGQHFEFPTRKH